MQTYAQLRSFVQAAARWMARQPDLAGYEIYAQSGEQIVARLNYTSDIPSRGVEETKSLAVEGFSLRINPAAVPHSIGTASIGGVFTMESVRRALAQARRDAVVDPHFEGLPRDSHKLARPPAPELMRLPHLAVASAAWQILRGALERFAPHASALGPEPGLVIGGDVTLSRERFALASSLIAGVRGDEDAYFTSTVTVLIEALDAKAAASAAGRSRAELDRAGRHLGAQALSSALAARNSVRPPAGIYPVILGEQPVAEILNYMVMPSLTAGAFYRADSAYYGRLSEPIMDRRISLYDDPHAGGGALRRMVSCEGIATARTALVRGGRLVALLSNSYDAARLARTGRADSISLDPRHGLRLGGHGGRRFDAPVRAGISNVWMRAAGGKPDAQLLGALKDGIHIGRVWYTYPINGQRAGDFTCTISGDSFLVEGGRVVAPIAPNCLRINAHIDQVFGAVREIGARPHLALVWGQPSAFYVPRLVAEGLALSVAGEAGA